MSSNSSGGNKKSASPSDVRYQARRKLSNLDAVHKTRRVARHKKRMAAHAAHLVLRAAQGKKD